MFYSETLLAKNGPLARVWLASNLERKLSKNHILAEHLDAKVKDIIGTGQAPMALRMSGQLLLGVVRIYSRKARYLLDDCSEALIKIKMAFRPGNVDLPSHQSHTANPSTLILPDTITELDLFAPMPDPEDLLREPDVSGPGRDRTLMDFGTSQLLPESQTPSKRQERSTFIDFDDDLGLDLGDDVERSIEIGRRAPTPRRDEPSVLMDDDLDLNLGFGDDTAGHESTLRPTTAADDLLNIDDDTNMGGMDLGMNEDYAAANAAAFARVNAAADERRQRDSNSPLSDVRASAEPDLEKAFQLELTQREGDLTQHEEDEQDATTVRAHQRVKRRRVMTQDTETELHNSQIKQQQEDRSGITKAPSFLPRDPVLLQLLEMQRNGGFVSNVMGEGRMQGWAPELRDVLSFEYHLNGQKKRKRDSGIEVELAELGLDSPPRLELPQQEDEAFHEPGASGDFGGNTTLRSDGAEPLVMSDGIQPDINDEQQLQIEDDDEAQNYAGSPGAPFDITEPALNHPSQTGPVSLGTKNAVHLLREYFAPNHPSSSAEPPTPSKRVKSEALFTDLCPEATTTTDDATKMFFELLVLGTKDAIKVEQATGDLGMPIRVRGKRGLWGDWAEREAGGEIAAQQVEVEA